MTVICWDGKTLAADKLGDWGGLQRTVTKIYRTPNGLVGFAGGIAKIGELLYWLIEQDGLPDLVPDFQRDPRFVCGYDLY